jgi:positive regulator of sigma E activity
MKGFTPRDYLIAAIIIIGVPLIWFLLIAGLAGHTGAGAAISIVIVISFATYIALQRQK